MSPKSCFEPFVPDGRKCRCPNGYLFEPNKKNARDRYFLLFRIPKEFLKFKKALTLSELNYVSECQLLVTGC